jgi:adenosylhomocysteine nucleosidase
MTIQAIRFTTGSLKDRRVVLAHSGIGKVNAATAATLLVEQFQPTHVLFTGIAGGLNPDLRPGDVVIGAKTAYHDYGEWTPEGFRVERTVDRFTGKLNPLFFPADAGLLAVAKKAASDLKLAPVKTAAGERIPRVVTGGDRDGRCVCGLAREEGRAAQRVQSRCDRDGRRGGGADLLAAAHALPDRTQPQ